MKRNIEEDGYLLQEEIPDLIDQINKPVHKLITRVLAYTGRRVTEALLLKPKHLHPEHDQINWRILKKNRKQKYCIECENSKVTIEKKREGDKLVTEYLCNNCEKYYDDYIEKKNDKKVRKNIPVINSKVIEWIQEFINKKGIKEEEYVFRSPCKDSNSPLPPDKYGNKPYRREWIWRIIHNAGKELNKDIHPHTLRHTFGIMLAMNDYKVPTIRKFLCHENIFTTQVYLDIAQVHMKKEIQDKPIEIET